MIVQRIHGIRTLLAFAQGGLVSLLFWAVYAAFMLLIRKGPPVFLERYVVYWAAVIAGLALEIALRPPDKLAAPIYESSIVRHFPLALRQMSFAFGGLLLLLVVTKDLAVSRSFLLGFALALYPALLWSNVVLPAWLTQRFFQGGRVSGTLLVGPAARVAGIEAWLARKAQFGVRVTGLLTTDDSPAPPTSVPVLGKLDRFEEVVADGSISQVILLELAKPELARWLVANCEQRGIRLLIVNDFAEQIHRPIVSRMDEGVNLLMLFEEPLENPFNRMLKRLLDLALSIPVVVFVLPPLAALVWVLHRLQSPGPLFHRQPRAGFQNRAFTIIKFRTMHVAHGAEERQATADDERIFPAGRWLRRFSLDEMPQFLNVWRGQMSVVGPRPHLIEHNRQFAEVLANYHVRAFIKPGITGLAQVRGFRGEARTREDIAARLESDLIYIENWSLSLDTSIVVRTIGQMLRPPRTAL